MESSAFHGFNHHKAPLSILRKLAARTCKELNVPPVTVSVRDLHPSYGEYVYDQHAICLDSRRGRNVATLAHELAHHVLDKRHTLLAHEHGPTFCIIYGAMLERFGLIPLIAFKAIAYAYDVRVAVTPDYLPESYVDSLTERSSSV
jgi:hypothetical protein